MSCETEKGKWLEERLCDMAAAELSMPRDVFDKYQDLSIRELASLFQVSPLMIALRQMEIESVWMEPVLVYKKFDRVAFIEQQFERGKPVAIVWMPSTMRLECRRLADVYGVSDLLGIREVPTLFSQAGMKKHRVFMIPYLVTGYGVAPEMED